MKTFPPLPKTLAGPAGPFTVSLVERPMMDNRAVMGLWDGLKRHIEIDKTMPVAQQWLTFFHELTHVGLADSGLDELLSHEETEAVCDAVATSRFRERFG